MSLVINDVIATTDAESQREVDILLFMIFLLVFDPKIWHEFVLLVTSQINMNVNSKIRSSFSHTHANLMATPIVIALASQ